MRELLQRYWALLRRKRTFVFVLSMFLAEFGVDYVNTILEPGLRAAVTRLPILSVVSSINLVFESVQIEQAGDWTHVLC